MPPDTEMLLSKVRVVEPDAVALLLRTTVHTPATKEDDTIVVFAGIPIPVTETPAPIATFVDANVTLGDPLVVVPVAVNTPTGVTVVPVNGPSKGLVLTVWSISSRFSPG